MFKKHLWGIRCLQDPGVNTEKGKESVFRKLPVFLCRFVWAFNRRGRPVHRLRQVFLLAVLCLACGPAADEAPGAALSLKSGSFCSSLADLK